jgi:hypothetical protein
MSPNQRILVCLNIFEQLLMLYLRHVHLNRGHALYLTRIIDNSLKCSYIEILIITVMDSFISMIYIAQNTTLCTT